MTPLSAVPPAEIVIMAEEEEINQTLTVTGKDISYSDNDSFLNTLIILFSVQSQQCRW